MGLRLSVVYAGLDGLSRDWQTQLKMGGFFAAVTPPPGLPPFAEVELELVVEGGASVTTQGRVTVANPTSVCIEILPEARSGLAADVERACAGIAPASADARRSVAFMTEPPPDPAVDMAQDSVSGADAPERAATASAKTPAPVARGAQAKATELTLAQRIAVMTIGEKVQLAAHGDAEARMLLARERTSGVQLALLRNPKMGLDEAMALARSPHINPEAAEAITRHPSFGGSAQVALMLIRNPKLPVPLAAGLIGKLNNADLRAIAKGIGVRQPIAAAARKRLLG